VTILWQVVDTCVPLKLGTIDIDQRTLMSYGWEGNRRPGVAMRHRLKSN